MSEIYFKIVSSNKRNRTITFKKFYSDGTFTKYRTLPLDRETWHYYTNHATLGDWLQFLKGDDYYILK